jgi:RimJ/RimL family protein N-acetyltransferase
VGLSLIGSPEVVGAEGFRRRVVGALSAPMLLPDARGHGIASAAVRLLAEWAIDALQIARLTLHIEPDNGSSVRLAERCGFGFEGRLRSPSRRRTAAHARPPK